LLFGRLSFEGEVASVGPLGVEITPSWIWGSPTTPTLDEKGFAIAGNVVFYLQGKRMQGFWIKAHVGYETFEATLTHPVLPECTAAQRKLPSARCAVTGKAQVKSPVLGGLIGTSTVFGRDGGFILSGGIGIGAATAGTVNVVALSKDPSTPSDVVPYYEGTGRIKILGTLGLGVAF